MKNILECHVVPKKKSKILCWCNIKKKYPNCHICAYTHHQNSQTCISLHQDVSTTPISNPELLFRFSTDLSPLPGSWSIKFKKISELSLQKTLYIVLSQPLLQSVHMQVITVLYRTLRSQTIWSGTICSITIIFINLQL